MAKVFAMIQWQSRGMEDAPIKFSFSEGLLNELLVCKHDGERDAFFERLTTSEDIANSNTIDVLSVFSMDEHIEAWLAHKSTGSIEEEFTWGIALTKEGAKAAFAEALNEGMGGDDDWGDDDEE